MRYSKGLPLKRRIRKAKKQSSYWDKFRWDRLFTIISLVIGFIIITVTIIRRTV